MAADPRVSPLKAGSRFPLTLRFEKAGEVQVQVQVQPLPPPGAAPGGSHHGKHKH